MRRPANWLQLVRFGLVGGVGFAVNLVVYAVVVRYELDYRAASVIAWSWQCSNNFVLNRHLDVRRACRQGALPGGALPRREPRGRGFHPAVADLFVEGGGLGKVPAQALAVAASMPLNFLGNKLWSFRASTRPAKALRAPAAVGQGARRVPIL